MTLMMILEENTTTELGNSSEPAAFLKPMMSNATFAMVFLFFFYTVIPIACFGVLTNTTNIIVFYKMGFAVVSNITLFALAISDLFNVTYTVIMGFANHPDYAHLEFFMPFPDVIMRLMPVFYCNQAFGSWVTDIISVERSFCVVSPIKVKMIFTRKTVFWLMIGMLIFQISGTPQYASLVIHAKISPRTNKTIYVIDKTQFNEEMAMVSAFVSCSVPTIACFMVVTIATIFLVIKFKQSRQIRKSMSGSKTQETISMKDAIMIRSVISICVIYIIGYSPTVAYYGYTVADASFNLYDPYKGNMARTLLTVGFLSQAISSSVNIFFYFQMSSKFKQICKELVSC